LVRRRRNQITEILLPDGNWIHSRREIGEYFAKYFLEIFQSSNPLIRDNLEDLILPSISEVENEDLTRILEINEIKEVVWEMYPRKSPEPDGFLGLFYKKYWASVGPQVVSAVQSFFRDGEFLHKLNHTYIHLIPKKIGACNSSQFRPISLCNFSYKIISKILVNRLRPLLHKLINPAQVAFVQNRSISENVVLA
jgi:hypothetical protein